MPKLPVLKPTEVVRALQRLGFVVVRSKGSHLQLKKRTKYFIRTKAKPLPSKK